MIGHALANDDALFDDGDDFLFDHVAFLHTGLGVLLGCRAVDDGVVVDFQRFDGGRATVFETHGLDPVMVLADQQVLDDAETVAVGIDQRKTADVLRFVLELVVLESIEVFVTFVVTHDIFPSGLVEV